MTMNRIVSVMSLLAIAGSASAYTLSPGDMIFNRNIGTINDSAIEFFDYSSGTITQLNDGTGKRLGALAMDNNFNLYDVNAPFPLVAPSVTTIYKFTANQLLSVLDGAPQPGWGNVLATGGDLRNPNEAVFDAASNQMLYPNNNLNLQSTPDAVQAMLGVNVTTGAVQRIVEDSSSGAFDIPNFQQLGAITPDPSGAGNYLFASPNGGTINPLGNDPGFTGASLWRLNGTSAPGATASLVMDLASAAVISDIGKPLGFTITLEEIPGENALLLADVGDAATGIGSAIYRVDLNPDGTFNQITTLIDQSSFPGLAQVGDVAFNPYTGKFVAASLTFGSVVGDFIFEFDTDGTGINVLANGVRGGDFVFVSDNIPAPGAVTMLGVAGLLGLRRRRN
jgi:hypothetical protein